jgi:hypothetical protein
MKIGEPIDARVPFIRALHDLDAAWQNGVSGPRQRAVEAAGKALGDALRADLFDKMESGQVVPTAQR